MSRHHGELFLLADRKNRMERTRLDQQLRSMDKDWAHNEFLIERQKQTLVSKLHGVALTTGHSDKALPPEGPHDRTYEKCKYNLSRLSEKRLLEWKVREKQLEKFLRQFTLTAGAAHGGRLKTRPSSSRSERMASRLSGAGGGGGGGGAGGRGGGGVSSAVRGKAQAGRVRSASAVLKHSRAQTPGTRRCASAAGFTSKARVVSFGEEVDWLSEAGEDDEGLDGIVDDSEGSCRCDPDGDEVLQSRLRSLSMVSLPQYHVRHQQNRCATAKPHLAEAASKADFLEASRDRTTSAALHTSEVIEKFKSNAKNYEDFVRAHSVPETKFFITKDSVVMTDGLQRKCRELGISHSMSDLTEKHTKAGNSRPCTDQKEELASQADRMSLSSVSSEDLADSVFLGQDDRTKADDDFPDTESVQTEQRTSTEGPTTNQLNAVSEHKTQVEDQAWPSRQNSFIHDKEDQRTALKREPQSATSATEGESCQKTNSGIQSVSRPLKKLSITDKRSTEMNNRIGGLCARHNKCSNCHPALHSGPFATAKGDGTRGHSAFAAKENLLMKRRHSKTVLLNHQSQSASAASQSSVVSVMTITPLLTKDSCQADVNPLNKQSNSVLTSRPSSSKPPRPSSSSDTDVKASTISPQKRSDSHAHPRTPSAHQHGRNSHHDNHIRPGSNQQKRNCLADPKDSNPNQYSGNAHPNTKPPDTSQQHGNSHPDPKTSASDQHNRTHQRPLTANSVTQNRNLQRIRSAGDSSTQAEDPNTSTSSQQTRNPQRPLTATSINTHNRGLQRIPSTSFFNNQINDDDENGDAVCPTEDASRPGVSQWRRDLELEQPAGLRSRVSSLGTVLKAAMVFSKAARKKVLTTMVDTNNLDTREAVRRERLRTLQSRASVLSKIVAQFPVPGSE